MSTTSLPRRHPDVWLRRTGDEAVLLGPDSDRIHILNDTAAALWELCDGTTSVREMVEAIVVLFDVDEGRVQREVEETLQQFVQLGVLMSGSYPERTT